MHKNCMRKQEKDIFEVLTVYFDVKEHSVKAEVVAAMIKATANLIRVAGKETSGNTTLEVNVRAVETGSLGVPIEVLIPAGIFLQENIQNIAATISVLKEYFCLKQWLQNKPLPSPQEDGTVKINDINIKAETINVYYNCSVEKDMSDAFNEIESDNKISDISITQASNKEKIVTIPRSDFENFKKQSTNEQPRESSYEETIRTEVTLRKAVFLGKGKWGVLFEERKINVKITDEEFLQEVFDSHQEFRAGDKLNVSLQIKRTFDEDLREMVIDVRGYEITKVYKVIHKSIRHTEAKRTPSVKQSRLFDNK